MLKSLLTWNACRRAPVRLGAVVLETLKKTNEVMNSEELHQTFEKFWSDIRGFNLYAGQPSNRQSQLAVSMAREAVQLATEARFGCETNSR